MSKNLYIKRTDALYCNCGAFAYENKIDIYTANSYHGKSLKIEFKFCDICVRGEQVSKILANSPLIFITYRRIPTLPSFLERIENVKAA